VSGTSTSLNQFPNSGLPEWEKAAAEELKGGNPWEKLTWQNHGLEVKPYLDSSTVGLPPPLLAPSGDLYRGPRAWHNSPVVYVQNASSANQLALQSLKEGAEGICFVLQGDVPWDELLRDIDWTICSLSFIADDDNTSHSGLSAYINIHYPGMALQGVWFTKNATPVIGLTSGALFPHLPSPIDELTLGFTAMLQHANLPKAISLSVDTDFFMDIAKLRSARVVHQQLLEHNKPDHFLLIHARSAAWISPAYDPHSAMLKHTTAAMAAILGGCDILTLEEDPNGGPMTRRIARQVSNLLREESHLGRVADPVAGSFIVEDLTRQISRAVWNNLKPLLTR
jgi:methylmalonyl-CoA mutase